MTEAAKQSSFTLNVQDELNDLDDFKTLSIDVDFIDPGHGPDGKIEHHLEINLPS